MTSDFTFATVCSGVEAPSLAWKKFGWTPAFFSEIEPFPCKVLKQRYPNVPNLGDMTKITGDTTYATNGDISIEFPNGKLDLLCGGTPCFTKGAMVLTKCGYKPIEDIKVGDIVLSHKGRFCYVTAIGSKTADIGKLKVTGRPAIECTPDHPLFCVDVKRDNHRKSETYSQYICDGDYRFVKAEKSAGMRIAKTPALKEVPVYRRSYKMPSVYNADMYDVLELAGWYCGDGYIRKYKLSRKKNLMLCLSQKKLEIFRNRFKEKLNWTENHEPTCVKVQISCTELCDWLIDNFREYSHLKRIPLWLYGVGERMRNAFLEGVFHTDGCENEDYRKITTTSPALAYGLADLMPNAYVCKTETNGTCRICGRECETKDYYDVRVSKHGTKTKYYNGYYNTLVRNYEHGRGIHSAGIVYNITVERDNSYIVNGLCVHNCQDLSVAGKRAGMSDGGETRSSLAFDFIRLLRTFQPRWMVWENVPGALSSHDGADFRCLLQAFDEVGYSLAWRVLDAQYVRTDMFPFAIPQRRRRLFVVGYLGDVRYPAEVLFERESLFWDTPTRIKTRKGIAANPQGSVGVPGEGNACTMQIRQGKPGGCKGALISNEWSLTLGCSNLQTLFQIGLDLYNQNLTNDISMTVTCRATDAHHVPCVMETWEIGRDAVNSGTNAKFGMSISTEEQPPLTARGCGYVATWRDGRQVADTITCTSANQYMPDKQRLQCVVDAVLCYEKHANDNTLVETDYKGGMCVVMDVCPTLDANYPQKLNNQDIGKFICYTKSGHPQTADGGQTFVQTDIPKTLNLFANGESRAEEVVLCYENHANDNRVVCFASGGFGQKVESEVASTISTDHDDRLTGNNAALICEAKHHEPLVFALAENTIGRKPMNGGNGNGYSVEIAYTQNATGVMGVAIPTYSYSVPTMTTHSSVRRLLPIETERLMGFEDDYTKIPWRGKPAEDCPDAPRYKACGNSMCVNCMEIIGDGISKIEQQLILGEQQ